MNPGTSMTSTKIRTKPAIPPGFRFHPTDVELVQYYLKRKVLGKRLLLDAIAEVDLYKFSPWDLPAKSLLRSGDLEWYFFCPRGRCHGTNAKTKRSTDGGYWKTTGKDRTITYDSRVVGMKKTLVYHTGRAGNGSRTNWVMHEYRLEDRQLAAAGVEQDLFVLCKLFEKSGPGPKNGEQRGAPFIEDEWEVDASMEDYLPNSACLETVRDEPSIGCSGHIRVEGSLDSLDRLLLDLLSDEDKHHPEAEPNLENSCVELGNSSQGPGNANVSDCNGLEIFEGLENLSLPGNYDFEAELQKTLMGFDAEPSGDFSEQYIELRDFYTRFPGAECQPPISDEIMHFWGYSSEISDIQCPTVPMDNASVTAMNVNYCSSRTI